MTYEYFFNASKDSLEVFPCKFCYKEIPFEHWNNKIVSIIRGEEQTPCNIYNKIIVNFNTKKVEIAKHNDSTIFKDISENLIKIIGEEMSRKKFFHFFLEKLIECPLDKFCNFEIVYIKDKEKKAMKCHLKEFGRNFIAFYSFQKTRSCDIYVEVINYRSFCKRMGVQPLEEEDIPFTGDVLRSAHKCLKLNY